MDVGDIIEHEGHRWRVRGIHLGGVGVESLIEIENISHRPGWTGEWETHQMMFVPDVLLRGCRVILSGKTSRAVDEASYRDLRDSGGIADAP